MILLVQFLAPNIFAADPSASGLVMAMEENCPVAAESALVVEERDLEDTSNGGA